MAKNTSYFTFALILQKVVSFTYFAILARFLGPESLGQYFFAISFASIFGIIIDIGIANVLTREIAKDQESSSKLISNILAIKIPLMFLSWILIYLFIFFLGYTGTLKYLILLSTLAVTLDSFTYTFYAISRGHHNLIFESISSVVFQLIVLCFGFYFLFFDYSILYVMSALVFASIFNFIYSSTLLKRKWHISFFKKIELKVIKHIFIISLPFGVFVGFQRLYLYLDSVLLKMMAGDYFVGLYQVAFKIIFSLQFLPMAFTASLYPAMSAYWKSDRTQLLVTFERAFSYLLIISLPISFGIAFLSQQIILIFSSSYNDAILPLIIIMFSLPFIFLNFPIGSLLNACDKQRLNTFNMGVALVASVILNIILIPKYQALGASITVLLTNMLMFLLGMIQIPGIIKIKFLNLLKIALKTLLASFMMSIFVYYAKDYLNIFFVVTISAFIYFISLYLLRGFRKEDIFSIYSSFIKK
ncbi:MAG: flippase [Patescibacteria group bacterium]|nr:flippase [Patescibacteria group bacterium]